MPLQTQSPKQRGFNLLEMLVAMALSLLVIAGVVALLVDAQRSQIVLQQQSRLHESARLALDILLTDIRQAGFSGCDWSALNIANAVTLDSKDYFQPVPIISGRDNVEDADANVVDGTDVLTLTALDVDSAWVISNQITDTNGSHFSLAAGSRMEEKYDKEILAAVDSDCSQLSLFRATRNSVSSVSATQQFLSGNSNNNCTDQLRGHFDCNDPAAANSAVSFSPDSRLYPFTQRSYAIREIEEDDVKTILLGRINIPGNNEVLVEGVTDLQVRYGLDSNADGAVDRFANAEEIDDSTLLHFSQVVSVEIDITVTGESQDQHGEPLSTTLTSSVTLRNGEN